MQDLLKLPLVGKKNKVVAVLTIFTDRTKSMNLFYLFDLYLKMYGNPTTGLENFMKFLGLNYFFQDNLTPKEMACLLHMRLNPAYKEIAKKLNISIKTAETHISHIISKLKDGQISTVLNYLRSRENI